MGCGRSYGKPVNLGDVGGGALCPHAGPEAALVQYLLLHRSVMVATPRRHCRSDHGASNGNHSSCRSWSHGSGHLLHRHQSRGRPRQVYLRKALFSPRAGQEPHQGVEGTPRRRPDVVLKSQRKLDAPDAARLRLLDLMEAPCDLPEELTLAPRPVRHSALATG